VNAHLNLTDNEVNYALLSTALNKNESGHLHADGLSIKTILNSSMTAIRQFL